MKKLLFMYPIILSCSVMHQTATIRQGISGKIYARQGNYMPSPGQKNTVGKPVSTSVLIYQETNREQALANGPYFDKINTRLIAKTSSNALGAYAVALPPGRYSVFVNDNNQLYANSFDGKGNINPIEVKKDSLSTLTIIISAQAVY